MSPNDLAAGIEHYLSRLRKGMRTVPAEEREEVIDEIRSHIIERLDAQSDTSELRLAEILRAVGDPDELASQYKTEALLRRGARSKSPFRLLHTTLIWATKGITGFIAFVLTLTGYGAAAVCYLCALLKPFFASHIGLWLATDGTLTLGYCHQGLATTELYGISARAPFQFVLGTLGPAEGPARELLGPWVFPVALLLGVIFVVSTTWFARWFIRRFRPPRPAPFSYAR